MGKISSIGLSVDGIEKIDRRCETSKFSLPKNYGITPMVATSAEVVRESVRQLFDASETDVLPGNINLKKPQGHRRTSSKRGGGKRRRIIG